jgi:DNA-binding NtrC family response regulator
VNLDSATRILLIDADPSHADDLATFLTSRSYEVMSCPRLADASSVLAGWRPHVVVLAPSAHDERHALEELRRTLPRLPIVVVTCALGPELLLELEAFAPAVPAMASRGLGHIESAIALASLAAAA